MPSSIFQPLKFFLPLVAKYKKFNLLFDTPTECILTELTAIKEIPFCRFNFKLKLKCLILLGECIFFVDTVCDNIEKFHLQFNLMNWKPEFIEPNVARVYDRYAVAICLIFEHLLNIGCIVHPGIGTAATWC